MLWEEGWLLKYYCAVVDGWVEKACRIHPFTCIHPILRFVRLLSFSMLANSTPAVRTVCFGQDTTGSIYFSFLPNKIICIFPAEEKQCCYSFMTAIALPTNMDFALGLCISGKAFNNHTRNKSNPKSFVLPWHSVINRGVSL